MKYKEMKRRLMALVLASSTFISSVSLVGCSTIDNTSSDNSYGELLDRDNNFKRYDVVLVNFGENTIDSEQAGTRPAVIIQNDTGNYYSRKLL